MVSQTPGAIRMRRYRAKNRDKARAAVRASEAKKPEYYKRLQARSYRQLHDRLTRTVLFHYSDGKMACACCGEMTPDFLTVDHIIGVGHRRRGTGLAFYRRLVEEGLPLGYQILCMNCNFSKGKTGVCAHKREEDHDGE